MNEEENPDYSISRKNGKVGSFRKLIVIDDRMPFESDTSAQTNVGPQRSKSRRTRDTPYLRTGSAPVKETITNEHQNLTMVGGLFRRVGEIVAKILPARWIEGTSKQSRQSKEESKPPKSKAVIFKSDLLAKPLDTSHAKQPEPVESQMKFVGETSPISTENSSLNISEREPQGILSSLLEKRQLQARKTTFAHLAQFFRAKGDQPMSDEEYGIVKDLVESTADQVSQKIRLQTPFAERSRRAFGGMAPVGPFYSKSLRRFADSGNSNSMISPVKVSETVEKIREIETDPANASHFQHNPPQMFLSEDQFGRFLESHKVSAEVETDEITNTKPSKLIIGHSSSVLSIDDPVTRQSLPQKTRQRNTRTFSARFLDDQPLDDMEAVESDETKANGREAQASERERILRAKLTKEKTITPIVENAEEPKNASSVDKIEISEAPKLLFNFGESSFQNEKTSVEAKSSFKFGESLNSKPSTLISVKPSELPMKTAESAKSTEKPQQPSFNLSLDKSFTLPAFKFGAATVAEASKASAVEQKDLSENSNDGNVKHSTDASSLPSLQCAEESQKIVNLPFAQPKIAFSTGETKDSTFTTSSAKPENLQSVFGKGSNDLGKPTFTFGSGTGGTGEKPSQSFSFTGQSTAPLIFSSHTAPSISSPFEANAAETPKKFFAFENNKSSSSNNNEAVVTKFPVITDAKETDKASFAFGNSTSEASKTPFSFGNITKETESPKFSFAFGASTAPAENPKSSSFAFGATGQPFVPVAAKEMEKPLTFGGPHPATQPTAFAPFSFTPSSPLLGDSRKLEDNQNESKRGRSTAVSFSPQPTNVPFRFGAPPSAPPVSIVPSNEGISDEMMADSKVEEQPQQQPSFSFGSPTFTFGSNQMSNGSANAFQPANNQSSNNTHSPQFSFQMPPPAAPSFGGFGSISNPSPLAAPPSNDPNSGASFSMGRRTISQPMSRKKKLI